MKTFLFSIILIFSSSLLQAQSINAPVYDNEGFFINGSILGAAWTIDDLGIDAESGAGFGLKLGYNFNTNFGLFASLDGASIDAGDGENYGLGHFDLGVQGTFRSTSDRFRPFVRASLIGMSAQDDVNDVEINGAGLGLGAGALIFLSETLALDINYTQGWVNLSEVKIGSQSFEADENAATGRFFIGLAYHF
ncbi:MAG: outer membrane beta-barrel protein [Balneolaceae bacterium]